MAKAAPIHKLTKPNAPLWSSASVLRVRLQEMLDFVDDARVVENDTQLHNMRIAAKRLRYTLEIFLPVLPPDAASLLKTTEQIQERLGAIHDNDVLIPLLEATLEKEMERERRRTIKKDGGLPLSLAAEGLAPQIARLRAERAEQFTAFWAFWDALPPQRLAEQFSALLTEE